MSFFKIVINLLDPSLLGCVMLDSSAGGEVMQQKAISEAMEQPSDMATDVAKPDCSRCFWISSSIEGCW